MVGYDFDHRGYRIYHTESGKIFVSKQVVFDEKMFPLESTSAVELSHKFATNTLGGIPSYPDQGSSISVPRSIVNPPTILSNNNNNDNTSVMSFTNSNDNTSVMSSTNNNDNTSVVSSTNNNVNPSTMSSNNDNALTIVSNINNNDNNTLIVSSNNNNDNSLGQIFDDMDIDEPENTSQESPNPLLNEWMMRMQSAVVDLHNESEHMNSSFHDSVKQLAHRVDTALRTISENSPS
ncbi:hypothetical protein TBLA_0B00140 [Henningerozyma blattae CBS 6284]|uniref:Retroviral polymerase SH3-like domain-containing protein n=1 Tax=Henningerozyma blattae (strain ATCC 34711 / CBS 6284 / DSM 70876 / NBRC 10599 / NRRL Y-10934 / UCD 77-7) TaxID=1071380 RepID=I2GXK7_HENB6|nr:hypothetical protein TBLA_0B00140 [Tetrapisispora blattae CBS 6284]CCH58859.1 hypothetical protein TBLA_0B00140 [Tetrapisispora blattae CBS 6284]